MFDYLQQFNSLPKGLRDQVSSSSVMSIIAELESKYKVDLAMVVMKVMIKNVAVKNLPAYFISEFGLTSTGAENLTRELKEKIFVLVAQHLGLENEMRALDLEKDIDILIKEAGLTLSSVGLVSRFKNIVATYLKGVRNKIDTRASLMKDVKIGGLNLSQIETDRVFKVCETQKFASLAVTSSLTSRPLTTPNRLNEIMGQAQSKETPIAEYDLKKALATGETKSVVRPIEFASRQLDTKHELPVPPKQLDLPTPEAQAVSPSGTAVTKPKPSISSVTPTPIIRPASVHPAVPIEPIKASSIVRPASIRPGAPISPINRPAPTPATNRPQIHDIKPMPRVMGPIEELQFLDLVNFRRLGKTAVEATAKIFSKIKLLEKDGYDKMVLGVRAWRQSPVNRLYLKLGQEAISKGTTIKETVAVRQQSGQENLSMEELEAVVSLNSKLVF